MMNIEVNGIKIPLTEIMNISDLINKFFIPNRKYIIKLNSKKIQDNKRQLIYLCNNDKLEIFSYPKEYEYVRSRKKD